MPGSGETATCKTDEHSCPGGAYVLLGREKQVRNSDEGGRQKVVSRKVKQRVTFE